MLFHSDAVDLMRVVVQHAQQWERERCNTFARSQLDLRLESGCLLWIDILKQQRTEQVEQIQRQRGMLYWVEKEQYRAMMRQQLKADRENKLHITRDQELQAMRKKESVLQLTDEKSFQLGQGLLEEVKDKAGDADSKLLAINDSVQPNTAE
jgi:hypothetical protein